MIGNRIIPGNEDDDDNDDEIYRVEQILGWRSEKDSEKYLVKWEGYDRESDNTWEPLENVAGNAKFTEYVRDQVLKLKENDTSGLVDEIANVAGKDLKALFLRK